MTREEGEARLPEARRRFIHEPQFGKCSPLLEFIEEGTEPWDAYEVIRHAMRIVPDRVRMSDDGVRRPGAAETAPKVETSPHESKPATGSVADASLSKTIARLKGSPLKAELVRYLWGRPDREAELRQVAIDVSETREASLNNKRMRSLRRQVERTRGLLEERGCPLRLAIGDNMVRLIEAEMSH